MDRRAFVASMTGGLLAFPLAVEAQPPRIGFVEAGALAVNRPFLDAFQQGLRELGYVQDRGILIEWSRCNAR